MVVEILDIDIKKYIIDKFTPAKLLETTIEFLPVKEVIKESDEIEAFHGQLRCEAKFPFARSGVIPTTILSAHILVDGSKTYSTKDIWQLNFNAKHFYGQDIQPGDTIGILPQNRAEDVQAVLRAMKLEATTDTYYKLTSIAQARTSKASKLPAYIPIITTAKEVLRDCLNLRALPKKQMLRALADCCTNDVESMFLKCLSSKEAAQHYNELILEQGLTLLDLLQLCATCQPNMELLIDHLPRLLPRPYSITNSMLSRSNEISIIFSMLLKKPGLSTSWLAQLAKQQKLTDLPVASVPIYIREATKFRYTTENASNNQLLICIGTGLAPFLGFLEHKAKLKDEVSEKLGETWLCVGTTNQTHVLQRQRLIEWQEQGILNKFNEALTHTNQPQRIQHLLQHNSKEYMEFLLQPNTKLYVCADGAIISSAINKCLEDCLQKELQIPQAEAAQMLKEWRKSGKFLEDLWL